MLNKKVSFEGVCTSIISTLNTSAPPPPLNLGVLNFTNPKLFTVTSRAQGQKVLSAFLVKMRFWYQNDPFNTENHFSMLTDTYNTSMAWYHQKMVDLSALCHNLLRAKKSHLADKTIWTNQNQFHKACKYHLPQFA